MFSLQVPHLKPTDLALKPSGVFDEHQEVLGKGQNHMQLASKDQFVTRIKQIGNQNNLMVTIYSSPSAFHRSFFPTKRLSVCLFRKLSGALSSRRVFLLPSSWASVLWNIDSWHPWSTRWFAHPWAAAASAASAAEGTPCCTERGAPTPPKIAKLRLQRPSWIPSFWRSFR